MTLDRIKRNEKVKIVKFYNDVEIISRLNNVGLKVGDVITVLAVAPFKTPIEIKTGNLRLAIAKKEAEKISVEYV